MNQNARRVGQHLATAHQRIPERLSESVVGTIIGIGFTEPKQATAVATTQRGKQIIKADANESRPLNQVHDRTNALADHDVRRGKGLMNSCLGRNHVAHLIVFEADDRVRHFVEPGKRLPRLGAAAFSLEAKGKGDERDDQRASFTGELCDIWGGARAGAATEPCANENHSGVGQRFADFAGRLCGCLIAQLGVAARAQTTSHRATELHFVRRHRTRQRLHIGIDRNHLGFLQAIEDDSIERIGTGAADAYNFDRNQFLFAFGQIVILAELNHIDLSVVDLAVIACQ